MPLDGNGRGAKLPILNLIKKQKYRARNTKCQYLIGNELL
jgi:hypothetical protein